MHCQTPLWTRFIKHGVDIKRVASLPSPLFPLHFELWEGEMVSSVNNNNSKTIVNTLGQVLPCCISAENTSVDGCKCSIALVKKGKNINLSGIYVFFLLALAPGVAWLSFRHLQLVDLYILQVYWNYRSLKWAMDQGQFGSQYTETGTIYPGSH